MSEVKVKFKTVRDFVAHVQREMFGHKIKRSGTNPHHKSKYSNLDDIKKAMDVFFSEPSVEKDNRVEYNKDLHRYEFITKITVNRGVEGFEDSEEWPLPMLGLEDSKLPHQLLASQATYYRRISMIIIFDLVCGDDDGNGPDIRIAAQQAKKSEKDRKKYLDSVLKAFSAMGVTKKDIEERYQTDFDQLDQAKIADLKIVHEDLKTDPRKKNEYFKGDQAPFGIDGNETFPI